MGLLRNHKSVDIGRLWNGLLHHQLQWEYYSWTEILWISSFLLMCMPRCIYTGFFPSYCCFISVVLQIGGFILTDVQIVFLSIYTFTKRLDVVCRTCQYSARWNALLASAMRQYITWLDATNCLTKEAHRMPVGS